MDLTWRRSTFCATGACVEVAWTQSSFCSNGACVQIGWRRSTDCASNACLEVAHADGRVLLRDSKLAESPVIEFTPSGWRGFCTVAAEWDREKLVNISGMMLSKLTGVETDVCLLEYDTLRHLHFSWEEWDAFLEGAAAGEFGVEVLSG